MEKQQSGVSFRGMSFMFKLRDLVKPRKNVLKEVGISPGDAVLDFGCGPGGYIPATAKLTGDKGKIYALDRNPAAIETVKKLVRKNGLTSVEPILSDHATSLPDNSIDVVLLYDVLHHLKDRDEVLADLHRVLKKDGVLSVTDHHMEKGEIASAITAGGLFRLSFQGKIVQNFKAT